MGRRILAIIVFLTVALSLGYLAGRGVCELILADSFTEPSFSNAEREPVDRSRDDAESTDPIEAQVAEMSLDEKIGQLVIVGLDGYVNDENSTYLIEKYRVGGFVLLKQNVKDTEQLLELMNSLKKTNAANKIPLFLAIDEEGGRISRLPDDFKKLPSSGRIGQANDKRLAYQAGSLLAEMLKTIGLNMNFAPVLDINSNPENPVIGDRAFGVSSELVTELGMEAMSGIKAQGIIPVVKHFPGHGDTDVDSHVGLPVVEASLSRLESFELIPFKTAIENQADAIMIAHILLPKIDPNNPASFSKPIITDLLRKKMNFDGVVITDDLTMGAVVNNYDLGEAAVESLKAGSDIILVCHDYEKEVRVIEAIKKAVETGKITEERVDESLYRILSLKKKYGLSDEPVRAVDLQRLNDKIEELYESYDL